MLLDAYNDSKVTQTVTQLAKRWDSVESIIDQVRKLHSAPILWVWDSKPIVDKKGVFRHIKHSREIFDYHLRWLISQEIASRPEFKGNLTAFEVDNIKKVLGMQKLEDL